MDSEDQDEDQDGRFLNSIGVLDLSESVDLDSLGDAICLPKASHGLPLDGEKTIAIGWDVDYWRLFSEESFLQVDVNVKQLADCRSDIDPSNFHSRKLCAGDQQAKSCSVRRGEWG